MQNHPLCSNRCSHKDPLLQSFPFPLVSEICIPHNSWNFIFLKSLAGLFTDKSNGCRHPLGMIMRIWLSFDSFNIWGVYCHLNTSKSMIISQFSLLSNTRNYNIFNVTSCCCIIGSVVLSMDNVPFSRKWNTFWMAFGCGALNVSISVAGMGK